MITTCCIPQKICSTWDKGCYYHC